MPVNYKNVLDQQFRKDITLYFSKTKRFERIFMNMNHNIVLQFKGDQLAEEVREALRDKKIEIRDFSIDQHEVGFPTITIEIIKYRGND